MKGLPMNLRTLMQTGPAKANELFARLAETTDGAVRTRERLFAELKAELELHCGLEEEHLFPVLRKNAETKHLVADAARDNRELHTKLAELEALPKTDEAFPERLRELQRLFRQHARDDKTELLPAVQRALSEEQVQGVAERIEAGRAEAEQAKHDEAEERRARARQEREQAEREARRAEAAERHSREVAHQITAAALGPAEVATGAAAEMAQQSSRLVTGANEATGEMARRMATPPAAAAAPFAELFLWPWTGALQGLQRGWGSVGRTVAGAGAEEVIPLGEEVLEVGKRTVERGTARVRRFVAEAPVEREVTLRRERVVVERRRPVGQTPAGEVLTELTIEAHETEEVPVVAKRVRVRGEVVVRTERSEQVETVRETLRRDEVEVQQPGGRRRNGGGGDEQRLRAVAAEG
jgi:uncharacterized protein (TIGR02271 family)